MKMGKRIEVKVGEKFGRWKVIKEVSPHPTSGNRMIYCQCQCGSLVTVRLADMVAGRSKSCGCISIERTTTHGCSKNPLYIIWKGMLRRCYSKKSDSYSHYGGRGISVVKDWHNLKTFIKWGERGYKPGRTIERKDSNGNYCPENCIWATPKEQNNNRSSNRLLEFDGKKMNMSQWADLFGINRKTLANRLRLGWNFGKAINTPVRKVAQ